eukprot:CAMPEP_0181399744 /NCGR_PEP_ID=MMETSP1110-20121109/1759_1 /TAXON_ID=174948 /ORGANISM="Symbiodinium sp., Strain CCMP421" /LENGTH=62 /DNA_ID=CAMNT_0023521825 /DNA_START=75 /DNA_END=263 /DNA_ORIENTATION=-
MSGLALATWSRVFRTSTGLVTNPAATPAVVPQDSCATGSRLPLASAYPASSDISFNFSYTAK